MTEFIVLSLGSPNISGNRALEIRMILCNCTLCEKNHIRILLIHRHNFCFFSNTGDYHNLEPKPKDTTSGPPEPVILKECFDLPLLSSYLGVFLGARGKHIKPLCTQYKVQMHLGEENSSESQGGGRRRRGRGKQVIQSSGDTIKVTVCFKPEDKSDVKGFKEELVKRAETVTKSREKHQENVSFVLLQIVANSSISLLSFFPSTFSGCCLL